MIAVVVGSVGKVMVSAMADSVESGIRFCGSGNGCGVLVVDSVELGVFAVVRVSVKL